MKLFKRSLAMLVALVMCVGMLSLNAFAVEMDKCSKCGEPMTWGSAQPTCDKEGREAGRYCSSCGNDERTVIAATGHDWKYNAHIRDASCGTAGAYQEKCSNCRDTREVSIPATGNHNYVNGECSGCGAKDPSYVPPCTVDDNCQASDHEDGCPKKPGHESGMQYCAEHGWHYQWDENGCKFCRDEENKEDVSCKDGHTWIADFAYQATGAQKKSTCTEKGYETHFRECSVCKAVETRTVERDLQPHDYAKEDLIPEKPATCTETGVKAHYHCSRCGQDFGTGTSVADDLTIPMVDHTPDEAVRENEVEPTATEDGSYDEVVYCTECDAELSRTPVTVPAAGSGNQGGNNTGNGNQGGNDNQGGTTGGTTGGVTDPDPVDSGDGLTTIEEEEVPLAGLPFDLDATDELTRGLFAYIIYWFEGEPDAETSSFTDVAEDHEYAQAIAWGDANGILLGYGDGTFRPDNGITREEMVLILNRYANYKKAELVVEMDGDPYDVMLWVEAEEIVNDFFDRLSGKELPEGQEAA